MKNTIVLIYPINYATPPEEMPQAPRFTWNLPLWLD